MQAYSASPEISRTSIPNHFSKFSHLQTKHKNIYSIVSPPRCSSTAFSRVFWEQPSIRFYSHEPFEVVYYENKDIPSVVEKLDQPLDLLQVERLQDTSGTSLLIKEMPYQVGKHFSLLCQITNKPLVFLIRDPRLNIASRIEKKRMVGDSINFPKIETGWELMLGQIAYCEANNIPHIIVDSTDFRNYPQSMFSQVFSRFDLPFSKEMLTWNPCENVVNLDNLDGKHRHLYARVLNSNSLQCANEIIPEINDFPEAYGIRDHVEFCLEIYQFLHRSPCRIRPQFQS